MNNVTITKVQAMMLGITGIVASGHLLYIPVILNEAGRDSWLSVLAALLPAIALGYVVGSLGSMFPGKTLVEYSQTIAGKWVGTGFAVIFLYYFFYHVALSIRGFGEFFAVAITPRTPILVFFVAIVILAAYAVRGGLEVLARTNFIFLLLMIPIGISASVLTHKDKDYENFLPILENGPGPMLTGLFIFVAMLSSFLVVSMVLPYVKEHRKLQKTSMITMAIIVVMFFGPITGPIALFGGERSMGMSFPAFQMLRDVEIGGVQRLDIIAILLWSLGSFGKVSLYLFAITYGLSKLLKLEDHRFLVVPVGALVVIFSLLLSDSFTNVYLFLQNVFPYFSLFAGFVLPSILLLVARIRFRKGRKGVRSDEGNIDTF